MKSYTDIKQSKRLAEILPPESADMWYQHIGYSIVNGTEKLRYFPMVIRDCKSDEDIPCWSLTALLEAIPKCIGDYNIFRMDINDIDISMWYDKIGYGVCNELPDITIKEPVDACVAMIEELHKQKLL